MRRSYRSENHGKIVFYAIFLAILCAIGIIVVQDIQVPMEHVTQDIKVNLEK